MNIIFNIIN